MTADSAPDGFPVSHRGTTAADPEDIADFWAIVFQAGQPTAPHPILVSVNEVISSN